MKEEEARVKYWECIRTLEELIEAGHVDKREIYDDLVLDD